MVDFINRYRKKHKDIEAAVKEAGAARFRPILLTSLTTFAGLLPLLTEKSMQAQFLIPMAVSLAFGVMFATFITLMLVPSGYMILEDVKRIPALFRSFLTLLYGQKRPTSDEDNSHSSHTAIT
jgi:multidrug efflux pump subunit AcrB